MSTAAGFIAIGWPKGVCPLCIAASGALTSTFGLGFLGRSGITRWVIAAGLLGGLALFARSARGPYRSLALALAVVGSAVVYAGWYFRLGVLPYVGTAVLGIASLVNMKGRAECAARCHAASELRRESQHVD